MPVKALLWFAAVVAALVIFPPVSIRSVELREPARDAARTTPERFALTFWEKSLPNRQSLAVELADLWAALEENSTRASQTYGQRAGVGARPVFLVRGKATVASIDARGVWVDPGRKVQGDTVLLSGPVFGNQVRDATGLIRIADFSSFEYNAISGELNRIVEKRVQPELRKRAAVGAHLEFFGAAELDDASSERLTLRIVPIRITWQ